MTHKASLNWRVKLALWSSVQTASTRLPGVYNRAL